MDTGGPLSAVLCSSHCIGWAFSNPSLLAHGSTNVLISLARVWSQRGERQSSRRGLQTGRVCLSGRPRARRPSMGRAHDFNFFSTHCSECLDRAWSRTLVASTGCNHMHVQLQIGIRVLLKLRHACNSTTFENPRNMTCARTKLHNLRNHSAMML